MPVWRAHAHVPANPSLLNTHRHPLLPLSPLPPGLLPASCSSRPLAGLVSPTLWIFESQRALAAGQWRLIPLGLVAGLAGSVLDSVLGATLQYSGYDTASQRIVARPGPNVVRIAGPERGGLLDNNAVNLVSASLTSALTAAVALKLFGF